MTMTEQQARGGHCTRGGTIASLTAVCECGAWRASDYLDAAAADAGRRAHLAEVRRLRAGRQA